MRTRNPGLEAVGEALVLQLGGWWHDRQGMCLCPVHADRTPSLSVRISERSPLFKCFAGCDTIAILRALRQLRLQVPFDRAGRVSSADGANPMPHRAFVLWNEARAMTDEPASRYLLSRGITLRSDALRLHPRRSSGSKMRDLIRLSQPPYSIAR